MRLMVTGFEPSPMIRKTPSGELAKLWASERMVDGVEVRSLVLPQVFRECTRIACAEMAAFRPDAVLMLGAFPSNDVVRIERFCVNAEYSRAGDNTGIPVMDRPVVPGGPPGYETTLPYLELLSALDFVKVRGRLSYHAGTHTCNSLFYGVRHFAETEMGEDRPSVGFVHVPFPVEFGFGIVEEESGLMTWPELRKATVAMAEALMRSRPGA